MAFASTYVTQSKNIIALIINAPYHQVQCSISRAGSVINGHTHQIKASYLSSLLFRKPTLNFTITRMDKGIQWQIVAPIQGKPWHKLPIFTMMMARTQQDMEVTPLKEGQH
jgi:hypothetical protein